MHYNYAPDTTTIHKAVIYIPDKGIKLDVAGTVDELLTVRDAIYMGGYDGSVSIILPDNRVL